MSIDRTSSIGLGYPLDRVDGRLKVQGQARYAAEQIASKRALIGWIVEADVAAGNINRIDTQEAEASPGVRAVLTHLNAPEQTPYGEPADKGRFAQSRAMLSGPRIRYHGYPVALVIADTLENARYAASLVAVEVVADNAPQVAVSEAHLVTPDELDGGLEADAESGEMKALMTEATHKLTVNYSTPNQVSAAMEPHACLAEYDGRNLTIHMSVQMVDSAVEALATTLKLPKSNIRVNSPFVGGGFGSKLGVHNETVLAALGAIYLKQPVKVIQSRRNLFANAPHRGNSEQTFTLAANSNKTLLVIDHYSCMPMAKDYQFAEPTGAGVRATYGASAIRSIHRVTPVDMPVIDSTRAPGDAIGSLAFECVIDEMAHQVGVDPLDFRLHNLAQTHPISNKPFASNHLRACLEQGAQSFGWHANRTETPAAHFKRGFGLAAAMRVNMLVKSEAELTLTPDGKLRVRCDMTDIGTGSYTILTQIVCDAFNVQPSQVQVELGDSDFPVSCGSGGSFGASSCGSAVLDACEQLTDIIAKSCESSMSRMETPITKNTETPTTKNIETPIISLSEDEILIHERDSKAEAEPLHRFTFVEFFKQRAQQPITVTGRVEPGSDHEDYAQYSTGAQFAEVLVDTDTGEVRVLRQLGVFSAGTILNRKTAASQLKGGMVWGAGYALLEEAHIDERYGAFVNRDLAEYHIAVNRDIGDVEVQFYQEPDYRSCPLGSKGIGELGIVGAGAAVANAIADATGVRVRAFPITADKILNGLLKQEG